MPHPVRVDVPSSPIVAAPADVYVDALEAAGFHRGRTGRPHPRWRWKPPQQPGQSGAAAGHHWLTLMGPGLHRPCSPTWEPRSGVAVLAPDADRGDPLSGFVDLRSRPTPASRAGQFDRAMLDDGSLVFAVVVFVVPR